MELGSKAKADRKPLPPDMLVGALHDRVHRDKGGSRPAKTTRRQRTKNRGEKKSEAS